MTEYKPYEEILKRKPDFRISYKIYSKENGGRWAQVYQGTMFNFWYDHPDHMKGVQFMIWPEFEDQKGEILRDKLLPVESEGTARMWIGMNDSIPYHKGKIQIGTRGFMMEGGKRIGEGEVIELLNIG